MNSAHPTVLSILYEDDRLLAVDKPAGILVIPDQYTDATQTLLGNVERYLNAKPWVVHRIDRDTTGVILFAKDPEAHALMCGQFEKGTVRKRYLALISGVIQAEDGCVDTPILVDGRSVEVHAGGKPSLTRYRVVERFRDFTLIELEPETGRRHQIRVHMESLGHPLAVDKEHGGREALYLSEFKKKYKHSGPEKPLLARLSLHAASITFRDPGSGAEKTIDAPLPKDFEVTLKQLRKHNSARSW